MIMISFFLFSFFFLWKNLITLQPKQGGPVKVPKDFFGKKNGPKSPCFGVKRSQVVMFRHWLRLATKTCQQDSSKIRLRVLTSCKWSVPPPPHTSRNKGEKKKRKGKNQTLIIITEQLPCKFQKKNQRRKHWFLNSIFLMINKTTGLGEP